MNRNKVVAALLGYTVALSFSASSDAIGIDAEKLAQINEACLLAPQRCLTIVDETLPHVPEKSHLWFDLLQHRFDALFDLQRFQQLYDETKHWLDVKAPFSFQITVYIYFAKTSFTYDGRETALKYAHLAKDKLEQMQQAFPSPMRLVELANLQMSLQEVQQAYELLISVESKYHQSKNAHFMMELYGNLAHAARRLGLDQKALEYWVKTVPWALEFNNKQQIGTVLYNLANAYAKLDKFAMAEKSLY